MALFTTLGFGITKAPWLCVALMPAISIVLVVIGFRDYTIEDSVSNIWIPESTSYASNQNYARSILGGSASSTCLVVSRPRQGGNILTASLLLELQKRLHDTEKTEVALHGSAFSFQDVCSNPAGPYIFPCLRMTVLDCYAEGGYDFSETAAAAWRVTAKQQAAEAARPDTVELGLDQAIAALYIPAVQTGLASPPAGVCSSSCVVDGPASIIAATFGIPAGTWEGNTTCATCLNTALSTMPAAVKDVVYGQVMDQLAQQLGLPFDGTALKASFNLMSEKDAWNTFLRSFPKVVAAVTAQVDVKIEEQVNAAFEGQTPYTFKTFPPIGSRRLDLLRNDSLAVDSDVLAAASGTCYNWDGGVALPSNIGILLYGQPMPVDFSDAKPLTSVEALQTVYSLLVPEDLQSRLAKRPILHGGPMNISLDQAEEVLAVFKKAFESQASGGWDDSFDGALEHTAFVDDAGAPGSFANTLSEVTTDSLPLIAIYGGVTVLLSGLCFLSRDFVGSRVSLVVVGSMFALLGCFAALGLSAALGISLNVVHLWIIPFIIVGIGIDDMFMMTLSTNLADSSDGSACIFAQCFSKVALPITMTSLVNAAMFAIMSLASDIRAVYQAGYTGLIATLILYLTMLLSFSALVFIDGQRRASGRYDCLPCVKGPQGENSNPAHKPIGVAAAFYNRVYRPIITSLMGQFLTLLLAIVLLIGAVWGLFHLPVGLDLQDFFPENSQSGQFAANRHTYFPVWPVTLNWGELNYTDPDVQLQMASQWEKVTESRYIAGAGLRTSMVWTAALAEWGLINGDASCASTFKENTLGLKLTSEGGICVPRAAGSGSDCPVLGDFTDKQFAQCIAKWKQSSRQFDIVGPRIVLQSDQLTPVLPIRYSSASGSILFAQNLRTTTNYTELIEETRKYVDDDTLQAWMSGIPFDYWEQYLTIVQVMIMIAWMSLFLGFLISFAFLGTELAIGSKGTTFQRISASFVAALFIALTSVASFVTVVGYCGLLEVKLSGFTAMSCLMSTGLAVEYSVHLLHHFLASPPGPAVKRIEHASKWLFAPSAMAFLTSFVSILMMAFSEFRFVRLYFFTPLAFAVLASYFFGAFALPCLLALADWTPALDIESTSEREKPTEPITPRTPLSKLSCI